MPRSFALIGVPTSAASHTAGQDKAPRYLRAAGLVERLRAAGLVIADRGDLPRARFAPDRANRRGRPGPPVHGRVGSVCRPPLLSRFAAGHDAQALTCARMLAVAPVFALIWPLSGLVRFSPLSVWPALLATGIVASAGGFWAQTFVQQRMAARPALLTNMGPVFAALCGYWLAADHLSWPKTPCGRVYGCAGASRRVSAGRLPCATPYKNSQTPAKKTV